MPNMCTWLLLLQLLLLLLLHTDIDSAAVRCVVQATCCMCCMWCLRCLRT
jgi:hypothetical protein